MLEPGAPHVLPSASQAALLRRAVRGLLVVGLALLVAFEGGITGLRAALHMAPTAAPVAAAGGGHVGGVGLRVVGALPASWDPAQVGDQASASTLAQVYETLTSLDGSNTVRPALAASWAFSDGGRQVDFRLRPGLAFSDGSPLTTADIVRSWRRLLDRQHPSPLASLLEDVAGVSEYLSGNGGEQAIGLVADGERLTVRFRRPATWFPAVAASPSLAVVPASLDAAGGGAAAPAGLVVSGAYVPVSETAGVVRLQANAQYWAGPPSIPIVEIVSDLQGRSTVDAFSAGDVDFAAIGSATAAWVRYDATLGPQLRSVANPAVQYYGFDTSRPPFNDVRVRQAFALAVDWRRLAVLTSDGAAEPATSLLPPGIPGRSATDFGPTVDTARASQLLAAAGYPGGRGFPTVVIDTGGDGPDTAVAAQLRAALGVEVAVEMTTDDYLGRLESRPPLIWGLTWIADYPAPEDFLGLLLRPGSVNNYGRWQDAAFEAALDAAAATTDAAAQQRAYDAAQTIVRDQAPVVPFAYAPAWALSREGLLGAVPSGVGILRLADVSWAP